jgi:hypothetical protein
MRPAPALPTAAPPSAGAAATAGAAAAHAKQAPLLCLLPLLRLPRLAPSDQNPPAAGQAEVRLRVPHLRCRCDPEALPRAQLLMAPPAGAWLLSAAGRAWEAAGRLPPLRCRCLLLPLRCRWWLGLGLEWRRCRGEAWARVCHLGKRLRWRQKRRLLRLRLLRALVAQTLQGAAGRRQPALRP